MALALDNQKVVTNMHGNMNTASCSLASDHCLSLSLMLGRKWCALVPVSAEAAAAGVRQNAEQLSCSIAKQEIQIET